MNERFWIRLKRPASHQPPGSYHSMGFRAGEWVEILYVGYPGQALPRDERETKWSFWTSSGIDVAAILDADDVDLVWLSPDHPRRQQLEDAGFEGFADHNPPGDVRTG